MPDLQRAAETGFSLADHARFYWADAAHQAGQPQQVVKILDGFVKVHPRSTLRFDALQLAGQAGLQVGQPEWVIRQLTAEPQTRRRPALAVLLAQASWDAKNPEGAARLLQEVYYAFPLSPEADTARDALARLRTELRTRFPEVTEEIQTARADILVQRSRWQDALDEYESLLKSRPASPLAPRWKIGRGRCLLRLSRQSEVIDTFSRAVSKDPGIDAQRLSLLIDAYLRVSDPGSALIVLGEFRKLYPGSPSFASALSGLGNLYVRQGDWKEAARYYQPLAQSFPQTRSGQEAHWRWIWSIYLDGDLNRAQQGFLDHVTRYPGSDRAAGAVYWLGRIAEARGAFEEARSLYEFLRERYVHDYYAAQAARRLRALKANPSGRAAFAHPLPAVMAAVGKIPSRESPPIRPCAPPPTSTSLRRHFVLRDLSLESLAEQYLVASVNESPDSPGLRLALSQYQAEKGNVSQALFTARRLAPRIEEFPFTELPEGVWRLRYPQEFVALVKKHAAANKLDLHLIMGLIRQESAFNPRATSVANARGLMQILPSTASPRRSTRARVARRLYDPEYNVRFGTRHLRRLLSSLDEIPEQALAAYHAGPTRVKQWLTVHSFQEPAEFLESIPISATRTYVEAVMRDAEIYRQLMTGQATFADCR